MNCSKTKNRFSRTFTVLFAVTVLLNLTNCTRTKETVFSSSEPTNVFSQNVGTVSLSRLSGITVCYTTDGSEPVYNAGACGLNPDSSSQWYNAAAKIKLSCRPVPAETADRTEYEKVVKIVFRDPDDIDLTIMSSEYYLNCDVYDALDIDGDGWLFGEDLETSVLYVEDNCPYIYNPEQNPDACTSNSDGRIPTATDSFFVDDFIMLQNWMMQEFIDVHNDGELPGGLFDWDLTPSNSTLSSGSIKWKTPLSLITSFTFDNATYDGCTVDGYAEGKINTSGTGKLATEGALQFDCATSSGFIAFNVVLTEKVITSGTYFAYCTQEDCTDTAVLFNLMSIDQGTEIFDPIIDQPFILDANGQVN